jgi:hypothetical protein
MRIRKEIAVADFPEYAKVFRDSDHWLPEMTDEVLASAVEVLDAYIEEADSYEDTESAILVKLADGRYGVFSEWSDSTGHG